LSRWAADITKRSTSVGPKTLASLNLRPEDLLGPVTRVKKKRFRGELVIKAHRLLYHSTLGLRVIKKKKRSTNIGSKTSASPNVRLKDLLGPVTRVKKKKKDLCAADIREHHLVALGCAVGEERGRPEGSGFRVEGLGLRL